MERETLVPIRLVKVDCEGSEIDILGGMTMLCGRGLVEAILVELNSKTLAASGQTPRMLWSALRALGFSEISDARTGRLIRRTSHLETLARESYFTPLNLLASANVSHTTSAR